MHLVGNDSYMQPTPLWSVDKFTFLHHMYKHYCSLPLLLVSVMDCCVKMYCYLLHNPLLLASFTCVHVSPAHL